MTHHLKKSNTYFHGTVVRIRKDNPCKAPTEPVACSKILKTVAIIIVDNILTVLPPHSLDNL